MAKKQPRKDAPAEGRQTVAITLAQGAIRGLDRVAEVRLKGNRSRVVEAALLELFSRLPEPLRSEVAELLTEDDPVSRLRAELDR